MVRYTERKEHVPQDDRDTGGGRHREHPGPENAASDAPAHCRELHGRAHTHDGPVMTWVVDTGMPATALIASVVAPAVSAAKPPTGGAW